MAGDSNKTREPQVLGCFEEGGIEVTMFEKTFKQDGSPTKVIRFSQRYSKRGEPVRDQHVAIPLEQFEAIVSQVKTIAERHGRKFYTRMHVGFDGQRELSRTEKYDQSEGYPYVLTREDISKSISDARIRQEYRDPWGDNPFTEAEDVRSLIEEGKIIVAEELADGRPILIDDRVKEQPKPMQKPKLEPEF